MLSPIAVDDGKRRPGGAGGGQGGKVNQRDGRELAGCGFSGIQYPSTANRQQQLSPLLFGIVF